MNENLLSKVKTETLDTLLDALCDVMDEMKAAAPERADRYLDEAYVACLILNTEILEAIKQRVLQDTGEKIEG